MDVRREHVSWSRISPLALIGAPPEHRDHRWTSQGLYPRIHPSATVEAFVSVDAGIERPTTIGARSWAMKHVHVGHDAVIGEDCELAPGVVVGGHVEIGDRVRMGVNACVRPFVKIGDGARIGCGAVVVKDVPPGETWVGNPARKLSRRDKVMEGWDDWFERSRNPASTSGDLA